KIHTVNFAKPGFLELPPISFDTGTEINLSFSTKKESGIILFGTSGAPVPVRRKRRQIGQAYYAVFLNKGRLEVHLSTGLREPQTIAIRPETGEFHDGREHSIRIERTKGIFTVQVDEDKGQTQRMSGDQSISVKKLFVGGVTPDFHSPFLRNIPSFEGCIWNLVINTVPMDFAEAASFKNADIGHCPTLETARPLPEEEEDKKVTAAPGEAEVILPASPTPPTPAPPLGPCVAEIAPVVLKGGKQFGLSRHSHLAIAFDDTKVKNRLTIEFEVRTEAESGLLFYMARINHADFATVQLKNGMAHFGYDLGHGNTSTMVPKKINDGQWHQIRIVRAKQRGILFVDGVSNSTISPKKADILDVVGMLYVGGLPINYITRRIGPVLHSIDGCVRNFKMTESPVDLDNPTSSFNVGSCFANAQKGTYFDGTGFAKAVDNFRVGMDILVKFAFRTTQPHGVLLGVSGQRMAGMGIELVDEKLLFHADNGVGRFSAIYEPDVPGSLCDGQWHEVAAQKIKSRLELTVDGKKVEGSSSNTFSTSADTNDPVFIGGYPEGMTQFALTSNTRFRGCIRDLKLTKGTGKPQEINFSKALELKGVQPLTCPAN
ncbi:laminin subunit alpha-2-like, partial [Microcaecilia unicolor]|uniref:Laminin subunit alpha-2-like n=1 Tax=Microcaecilia unicolor TaxID=1415580 RepID=A0A6P7X3Z5_9AMPH